MKGLYLFKNTIPGFFLACFFLVIPQKSMASHVAGGEISYRHLGNDKYVIYAKAYRDCNGISQFSIPGYIKCADTNLVLSFVKTGVSLLFPPVPICPFKSKCSGSFPYGFEEHKFADTVDLSAFNSCEWNISFELNARPNSITTGQGAQNLYVNAILNKCISGGNSSPYISKSQVLLLCQNEDFVYSFAVKDTSDTGDSFSYALTTPLQHENTPCTYSGNFSAQRPLTFYGFPNQNLPSPAGFHLNPTTGVLSFRPTQLNEHAVVAVEISEWREINGIMTKIGTTKRDVAFNIISCASTSNPPEIISAEDTFEVCSGSQICIDIETNDIDNDDILLIVWNKGIPGATFTNNNHISKHPSAQVCWTPTKADVSDTPYTFSVTARDDFCPFNARTTKTFTIYVSEYLFAYPSVKTKSCGELVLEAMFTGNPSDVTYTWTATDSLGHTDTISHKMLDSLFLPKGVYVIRLNMSKGSVKCGFNGQRIVTIQQDPVFVDIISDTTICRGDSIILDAGTGYSAYSWSTGDTTQTLVAKTGNYEIEVSDSQGCKANDQVNIDTYLPDSSFSYANQGNNLILFTAQAGYEYLWNFGDGNTSTSNPVSWQYPHSGPFTVSLQVKDSNGCYNTNSGILVQTGLFALNEEALAVQLYPNPASDLLHISAQSNDAGLLELEILDITGRTTGTPVNIPCRETTCKETIDVSSLSPGVYSVKIQLNGKSARVKFVKL